MLILILFFYRYFHGANLVSAACLVIFCGNTINSVGTSCIGCIRIEEEAYHYGRVYDFVSVSNLIANGGFAGSMWLGLIAIFKELFSKWKNKSSCVRNRLQVSGYFSAVFDME